MRSRGKYGVDEVRKLLEVGGGIYERCCVDIFKAKEVNEPNVY